MIMSGGSSRERPGNGFAKPRHDFAELGDGFFRETIIGFAHATAHELEEKLLREVAIPDRGDDGAQKGIEKIADGNGFAGSAGLFEMGETFHPFFIDRSDDPADDGVDEGVFGTEVVVDRGEIDAGGLGQGTERDFLETFLREEGEGGVEDAMLGGIDVGIGSRSWGR